MAQKAKAIPYIRDHEVNPDAPYATKFATFIQAIVEAKTFGCDIILIAEPWVIGDTYEEIAENLSLLGRTGVHLQVVAVKNAP